MKQLFFPGVGLISEEFYKDLVAWSEEAGMLDSKDKVFVPGPNRIFVFGSNESGVHGAGAAKTAYDDYGAEWGKGVGLMGNSYGIPTKDFNLKVLPISKINYYVDCFIQDAMGHPDLHFFVTRIGCGLAGYTDEQIAPLFRYAPANVELPEGWR